MSQAVAGTLEFKDGEEEKTITVKIKDDDDVEDDETFLVKISDPSIGKIGPFGSTTVTIIDDDEPGEIGIKDKDAELSVLEADGKANVIISRMNGSAGPISCFYTTKDGSGVAGTNYTAVSGELKFDAGQISKKIDIVVIDTGAYEINAGFTLELSDFVCSTNPERSKVSEAPCRNFDGLIILEDWRSYAVISNSSFCSTLVGLLGPQDQVLHYHRP